jgi:RimJ/RimL family protein N-acetyltransferase
MTDGVVTLRRFRLEDAGAVYEACQDSEIARWTATIPSPYPMEAATGWIGSHDALWSGGLHAPFAAVGAEDDRLLGSMTIRLKPEDGHAVAGYWIAAPERGRGAATRALGLALEWVRDHSEVPQVVLRTMVGNVASERVAQKNGFTYIADEDNYTPTAGDGQVFHVKLWAIDLN